ncbi:MAG: DEAD/DEAH box helicase, partial [Candidatus Rokubacteria bacterium]|nr:DEAD/DEAH box helicase [Candidatus Rokubacteria bacterium]
MSFNDFALNPTLLRGVSHLGFEVPTPIQRLAIPPALEGRDVLACAMTGSGKTAAFMLPILERLLAGKRGTRALVLTPTRELAAQIEEHTRALGRHAGVGVASVIGGVAAGPQETALRRGIDIVIATPGRLLDHLRAGIASFDKLEVLVLDEADRMLDMGFIPDVRRILGYLPKQRQTLFFSATLPAPVVTLSRDMLRTPVMIDIERPAAPAVGITHAVYPVAGELKSGLLMALLRQADMQSVLVFTRTKHRANRLTETLARNGIAAERIHGNRTQAQRIAALAGFKAGKFRVLVATDIAARGIDVTGLSHVVNFDVPNVPEDYIHRVGRTARAEATGDAITLVSPDEEGDLKVIERAIGKRLERATLAGFDYAKRPAERLEIPIAERIAAIRARKSDERARARANAARRG